MSIDRILAHLAEIGCALGKSTEALENEPTPSQELAARDAILQQYPWLREYDQWWLVVSDSFRTGYALGKTWVPGAQARVRIKREARANERRNSSGA